MPSPIISKNALAVRKPENEKLLLEQSLEIASDRIWRQMANIGRDRTVSGARWRDMVEREGQMAKS